MKYDNILLLVTLLRNFLPLFDIEKRRFYIEYYQVEEKMIMSG